MNRSISCRALLLGPLFYAGVACGQTYAELWGKDGEKWAPQSRLPDFSFAGYHSGEKPIPTVKAVTDVTSYGAKGDGKPDCTQAFIKATEPSRPACGPASQTTQGNVQHVTRMII
jgi:hypothetical protein